MCLLSIRAIFYPKVVRWRYEFCHGPSGRLVITYFRTASLSKCHHVASGHWGVEQIETWCPKGCNPHTRPKSETEWATQSLAIGNHNDHLPKWCFDFNSGLHRWGSETQRDKSEYWKCNWSCCKWANTNVVHQIILCLVTLALFNTWPGCVTCSKYHRSLWWFPVLFVAYRQCNKQNAAPRAVLS